MKNNFLINIIKKLKFITINLMINNKKKNLIKF